MVKFLVPGPGVKLALMNISIGMSELEFELDTVAFPTGNATVSFTDAGIAVPLTAAGKATVSFTAKIQSKFKPMSWLVVYTLFG